LDETVFLSNFLKFSAVQAVFESYQGIMPYFPDFDVYDYTPESKNYRHLHDIAKTRVQQFRLSGHVCRKTAKW